MESSRVAMLVTSHRPSSFLAPLVLRDLLGLDAGGVNHLRPFWNFTLDPAGEFFRRGVDDIKAERCELLSSLRLDHRLADLAIEQLDNGWRRVGGDNNTGHGVGLLAG